MNKYLIPVILMILIPTPTPVLSQPAPANGSMDLQACIGIALERAYFQLAAALEMESAAGRAAGRADEHRRVAQILRENGAVPPADVFRAQVEAANAWLGVEKAESLVRISRGRLNTLIGHPVNFKLDIDTRPQPMPSPEAIEIAAALEVALEARPDLKVARQRVEASRLRLASARSAFGPRVSGEGRFGWRASSFLPEDKDWLVGVWIELPIFDGFRRKQGVSAARAEISREEAEYERLTQEIQQEIWAAHSRVRESHAVFTATESLVEDAAESARLADARYRAGAGTITDLLDSETALARAEASLSAARWDCHSALAELRYTTAGGDSQHGPELRAAE